MVPLPDMWMIAPDKRMVMDQASNEQVLPFANSFTIHLWNSPSYYGQRY